MEVKKLWANVSNILSIVLALGMMVAVLALVGDLGALGDVMGQAHSVVDVRQYIPSIPWRSILGSVAVLFVCGILVATWGNLRYFVQTHRSVDVKIIE